MKALWLVSLTEETDENSEYRTSATKPVAVFEKYEHAIKSIEQSNTVMTLTDQPYSTVLVFRGDGMIKNLLHNTY